MKRVRQKISYILSLTIVVGAIYILVKEWSPITTTLLNAEKKWIFSGLSFYLLNYTFRSLRILNMTCMPLKKYVSALYISAIHGFSTYMFPMKTGELTLPLVLQKNFNIPFIDGGRILLRSRLLDITVIGICMVGTSFSCNPSLIGPFLSAYIIIGISFIAVPYILIFISKNQHFRSKLKITNNLLPSSYFKTDELVLSLMIWLCIAMSIFCAAHAIDLNLTIWDTWILITIQLPMMLLPIQGIASTGTHEGGWVSALILIGYTSSDALKYSIASHSIIIIYVLSLTPLIFILKLFTNRGRLFGF